MKARDVILRLMETMPALSDSYSEYFNPVSVSVAGSIVTVNQVAHGLQDRQAVSFTHGTIDNIITSIVDNGNDTQTITLFEQCDLTNNWKDEITIKSNTDPSLSGAYALLADGVSEDRLSLTIEGFTVPDVLPADTVFQEDRDFSVNGLFNITKVSDDVFTYQLIYDLNGVETPYDLTGAVVDVSTFRVHNKIRITGAASIEKVIDSYTAQTPGDLYLYVVLGSVVPNKNEDTNSDNDMEQGNLNDWNGLLKESFSIFAIDTISENDTGGRATRDIMGSVRVDLFRSILGTTFDTGFAAPADSTVYPTGDDKSEYPTAYYIHDFGFAMVATLSNGDVSYTSKTSALSNINYDINDKDGSLLVGTTVELDE